MLNGFKIKEYETKTDFIFEFLWKNKDLKEKSKVFLEENNSFSYINETELYEKIIKNFISKNILKMYSIFDLEAILTKPNITWTRTSEGYVVKGIAAKHPTLEVKVPSNIEDINLEKKIIDNKSLDDLYTEKKIKDNEEYYQHFLESVDRKSLPGDYITLDVRTTFKKELLDDEKDLLIILNEESFHPELYRKMLNREVKENFIKEIEFDANYPIENYKNKNIVFEVFIKKISEIKIDKDSIKYLEIEKQLEKEIEVNKKNKSIVSLIKELKDKNTFLFNISKEFINFKYEEYKNIKLSNIENKDWLMFLLEKNKLDIFKKIRDNIENKLILNYLVDKYQINIDKEMSNLSKEEDLSIKKINLKLFDFLVNEKGVKWKE